MSVDLRPIGVVHVNLSDEEVKNSWIRGGVEGIVEVFPKYERGLEGIDGFSHILLVTWLHKHRSRDVLMVKPRIWLRFGIPVHELPTIGVFCSDSPDRPNPIGLTIVELVRREGRFLFVRGLDLYDGTPVLDIRVVTPDFTPKEVKVANWYLRFKEVIRKYLGKELPI